MESNANSRRDMDEERKLHIDLEVEIQLARAEAALAKLKYLKAKRLYSIWNTISSTEGNTKWLATVTTATERKTMAKQVTLMYQEVLTIRRALQRYSVHCAMIASEGSNTEYLQQEIARADELEQRLKDAENTILVMPSAP